MTITRREFTRTALIAGSALVVGGGRALAIEPQMLTRAIPSSGEKIPVIGLGTNRYGVGVSVSERAPLRAALSRFSELGGRVIDTAPSYRTSETVLGDLIKDLKLRKSLYVATKVDRRDRAASIAQMNNSLDSLRSRTIDLMQVHNLKGWEESLPLLREWKQEGRIRYVGITTSRNSQYEEFEKVMQSGDLDFIQVNYSLEQRESAARILPLAADKGIAVMINRAFGGGRIFDAVGDQPLPQWAREFDCDSWAQFLLKYALSHPAATVVIPGMTKVRHVEDNIFAGYGRLPNADERAQQEAFFDAL